MDELKQQIALTAINKMMASTFFSICEVRDAMALIGSKGDDEAYKMLHALHCVHFDQMPKSVYEALPGLIYRCMTSRPQFQFGLEAPGEKQLVVYKADPTPMEVVDRGLMHRFRKLVGRA